MSTCARNLPQHFNGCACAPAAGRTSAEATEVDLLTPPRTVHDAIVAEGDAWEMSKYAEMGRLLAQQDLAAEQSKPFPRLRRKRIAALTNEVAAANARVTETRRAQVDAYYRIDEIPAVDQVEALDREVAIAHRHAGIMRRMIGMAVHDRDHDETTRRQRQRIQRSIDFYDREERGTRSVLAATRAARERAAD